jgi:hypothetical protein
MRPEGKVRSRALFPQAHIYAPREYVRFALGGTLAGMPPRADRVQYLGGDLMHAARIHARLGGVATTYKFSRKGYVRTFARAFAVDEANRAQLVAWGTPPERIAVVGNLAIDGALGEAAGDFGDAPSDVARDGIVILPGSRKHEVENLYSLFIAVALQLRRRLPGVPIAFGRSPFVTDTELRTALQRGGDPRVYGTPADLCADGAAIRVGTERFALVSAAMRAAASARLAITIPGTKVIELGALGVPAVVCVPLNVPELVVINGPFQYLGRLPGIGMRLKRAAVLAVSRRFAAFAQPNIDAERMILPEIVGTIMPARVAAVAAERYADTAWCAQAGTELRALYAGHAGAARRMSDALLDRSGSL